jgi:hypothetical protein
VSVLLRPDAANLTGGPASVRGVLVEHRFRGSHAQLSLDAHGLRLTFDVRGPAPAVGEAVTIYFDPAESIQLLPNTELSSPEKHSERVLQ